MFFKNHLFLSLLVFGGKIIMKDQSYVIFWLNSAIYAFHLRNQFILSGAALVATQTHVTPPCWLYLNF